MSSGECNLGRDCIAHPVGYVTNGLQKELIPTVVLECLWYPLELRRSDYLS